MPSRNMPGTPKQRSVGRPVQGPGPLPGAVRKTALSTRGIALQVPTFKRSTKLDGPLHAK